MSSPLTPRETDVVAALADGLTAKQIGRKFDISPNTVHNVVIFLRAKTGAANVTGLVAKAIREGWIQ